MASKSFARSLRAASKQAKAPTQAFQRRSFVSALASRPVVTPRAAIVPVQQTRGVKTIDFAGTKEDVYGKLLSP